MKTRILKSLAIAWVAAFAFATPAAALNIEFEINGANELRVIATGLGPDIIAAWDFDIRFAAGLNVESATTDNQLGESNVLTAFGWSQDNGSVDAFEVSFLSDADLATLQDDDPLLLLTLVFEQDISNEKFSFVWDRFNDVKCAANRVCFPPVQVPEPGTLLLLGLGMLGVVASRRRRAA